MNSSLFIYMLSLILIQGLMYVNYRLFLRRETWFRFNRFYLLSIPILSILLPLMEVPINTTIPIQVRQLEAVLITPTQNTQTISAAFSWEQIVWNIYFTGVIAALVLFLYRLKELLLFIDHHRPVEKTPFYSLYHTGGVFPTSSFFRYIFWDETQQLDEDAKEKIITHECYHIRQKHSWDLLYLEIMQIIFWFNPFIYLIRKELALVHEFLADRSTVAKHSKQDYAKLILQEVLGTQLPMTHPFFESPALSRIQMLQTIPNLRRAWKNYSSVILVIFILLQLVCVVPVSKQVLNQENLGDGISQTLPEVNDFVVVEESPKALNMRDIKIRIGYPQEAREAGIEGNVVVRILVDQEGNYMRHIVLNEAHPSLQEAVERELPVLQFNPAVMDGKPVAFWVNIPFSFKLIQ